MARSIGVRQAGSALAISPPACESSILIMVHGLLAIPSRNLISRSWITLEMTRIRHGWQSKARRRPGIGGSRASARMLRTRFQVLVVHPRALLVAHQRDVKRLMQISGLGARLAGQRIAYQYRVSS